MSRDVKSHLKTKPRSVVIENPTVEVEPATPLRTKMPVWLSRISFIEVVVVTLILLILFVTTLPIFFMVEQVGREENLRGDVASTVATITAVEQSGKLRGGTLEALVTETNPDHNGYDVTAVATSPDTWVVSGTLTEGANFALNYSSVSGYVEEDTKKSSPSVSFLVFLPMMIAPIFMILSLGSRSRSTR